MSDGGFKKNFSRPVAFNSVMKELTSYSLYSFNFIFTKVLVDCVLTAPVIRIFSQETNKQTNKVFRQIYLILRIILQISKVSKDKFSNKYLIAYETISNWITFWLLPHLTCTGFWLGYST